MAARRQFWRTDWFTALLIVLAVLALHRTTEAFSGIERRLYDVASTASDRVPSDRIAIIAIDDESIANIGRWPWTRDVHAQLIDLLAAAKARTIVHTVFFFEPQIDRGLAYIQKVKQALQAGSGDAAAAQVIAEAEIALDTDARLADSIRRAGNVLVPSFYTLGTPRGRPDAPLPPFAARDAIDDAGGVALTAVSGRQPIERIGAAAAGVGHLNQVQDGDGAVREEPLLINYYGQAVPSLALLAAAHSLNLAPGEIRLGADDAVQLGRLQVPTHGNALMLPQFYRGAGGKRVFPVDSFYDVLTGRIPASKYAGKIVLIGATAAGLGVQFATPASPGMSPVETVAHIASSLLSEHFIAQPSWAPAAASMAFLLVAAYLILALPRLSAGVAASITAMLFIGLLAAEYLLLSRAATWLQLAVPAALLALGYLAITTKRFLLSEAGKLRSDEESADANRMMGLALQGQGQLDMAFDRFRRVPLQQALMENLYNLALDFERKRQFNKAQSVYEYMHAHDPKFRDLEVKLNRARTLSDTVLLGGGAGRQGNTLLLDQGAVEKPMLGRYQVEKELGKGAMGVVYQGRDPKIGRVVAIKTLALGEEFEGDALTDARERFFREAETAGRLQHHYIVTIFDAGEEHDLAYIAMEFLQGRDLVEFCREGHLLPVDQVVSIAARVAEALHYAHTHNVVHRDIKPANIMWDRETDTVKVTDFGIARITDSSKTRTGLVLGTPSFMSPEQLAGKKVDGRSDLYSLGVMMFQLLGGALPFRAESMTELMYKIANEPAPDIRTVRPDVPAALAEVVAATLRKNVQTRYQDGNALADALRATLPARPAGAEASPPRTGSFGRQPAPVPHATAAAPGLSELGSAQTVAFDRAAYERELNAAGPAPGATPPGGSR